MTMSMADFDLPVVIGNESVFHVVLLNHAGHLDWHNGDVVAPHTKLIISAPEGVSRALIEIGDDTFVNGTSVRVPFIVVHEPVRGQLDDRRNEVLTNVTLAI